MIRVRVPAKINLTLNVGPRREDGYHPLATVFHAVSLHDDLYAEPADQITLTMTGLGADELPTDSANLAVRAAEHLRERYGNPQMGAHLRIDKHIPVAGGMAGGSADGAAALIACNHLWGLGLSAAQLSALAADLGSDMPFSLLGGTALGQGRGEVLEPLDHHTELTWVIATATRGLSTPTVFAEFDRMADQGRLVPDQSIPHALVDALARGDDVREIAGLVSNSLQPAALSLYPELAEHLRAGTDAGAFAALVSGSGPTCVYLCEPATVPSVEEALRSLPSVREVVVAHGPVAGPSVEEV